MIEVTPYSPPNFWTLAGTILKQKQLAAKFPNIRNWRFITVTFDRYKFGSPLEAYRDGIRHLRQFIYELREKYTIKRYCWKLELHKPDENGEEWPHFHLLIDYKRKIDAADVLAAWRRGRVDIKHVKNDRFDYLFKYISKAVSSLPEWLTSLTKPRAWQTSKGFFACEKKEPCEQIASDDGRQTETAKASPRLPVEPANRDTENKHLECEREAVASLKKETLGARIQRWATFVVTRFTSEQTGKPVYRNIPLDPGCDWGGCLAHFARRFLADFREAVDGFTVTATKITIPCQKALLMLPLKNPLPIMAAS